jgi:hypothetical protein
MFSLHDLVPPELLPLSDIQKNIPRIAKDPILIGHIERAIQSIPTTHSLFLGDARKMSGVESESVHLVVTSPPYWTLKEYRHSGA